MMVATRLALVWLGLTAATPLVAQVFQLPSGDVNGSGVIDDGGRARIAISIGDDGRKDVPYAFLKRRPILVEMYQSRARMTPLGDEFSGLALDRFLDGGDLLLKGHRGPVIDGYTAMALEIATVQGDNVRRAWGWNSRRDSPECGSECDAPIVSPDGRMWGYATKQYDVSADSNGRTEFAERPGVTFSFGRTRRQDKASRIEHVDLPILDNDTLPMWGRFWFLDTSAPVVLIPWRKGGYIVRFVESAPPRLVSLLQESPTSTRWWFTWQNQEKVLWAWDERQLCAYNLWDLGLSGFPEAPFWDLDTSDGWEAHPERGAVRIVRGDDAYRIEHAWREPWTLLEERYLSGWISGSPPPRNRVLVSPNGRHAVVLESHVPEAGDDGEPARPVNQARQVRMTLQPLQPPVPASALPADGNEGERPGASPDG